MAGFFFCLASAEGARLLFCPAAIHPNTSVYSAFFPSMQLYRPRCKIVHRALQWLFLRFAPFYRRKYQTSTSGYNTACATLERLTEPQHLQHIQDTSAAPGRCTAQHSRPIIIRYIRCAACYGSMPDCATDRRPCQPGGGLYASHARRLAIWHRVSNQGAAGGAEPLAACAVSVSGFRPIANKGKQ